jgi:hypothetical protein
MLAGMRVAICAIGTAPLIGYVLCHNPTGRTGRLVVRVVGRPMTLSRRIRSPAEAVHLLRRLRTVRKGAVEQLVGRGAEFGSDDREAFCATSEGGASTRRVLAGITGASPHRTPRNRAGPGRAGPPDRCAPSRARTYDLRIKSPFSALISNSLDIRQQLGHKCTSIQLLCGCFDLSIRDVSVHRGTSVCPMSAP